MIDNIQKGKKQRKSNMYSDRIGQAWNPCVGCNYDCVYCRPSFQRQMKRQKNRCILCGNYTPHFHPERLSPKYIKSLPLTYGDGFIWPVSSGDISCMEEDWIQQILDVTKSLTTRIFLFQSKDPAIFNSFDFPTNSILATTYETNRKKGYELISKAPEPEKRIRDFLNVDFYRKRLTIEPILTFDLPIITHIVKELSPEIVYIGYDSRFCGLPEPTLYETNLLIKELCNVTKVKLKLLRERGIWANKYTDIFYESGMK